MILVKVQIKLFYVIFVRFVGKKNIIFAKAEWSRPEVRREQSIKQFCHVAISNFSLPTRIARKARNMGVTILKWKQGHKKVTSEVKISNSNPLS